MQGLGPAFELDLYESVMEYETGTKKVDAPIHTQPWFRQEPAQEYERYVHKEYKNIQCGRDSSNSFLVLKVGGLGLKRYWKPHRLQLLNCKEYFTYL